MRARQQRLCTINLKNLLHCSFPFSKIDKCIFLWTFYNRLCKVCGSWHPGQEKNRFFWVLTVDHQMTSSFWHFRCTSSFCQLASLQTKQCFNQHRLCKPVYPIGMFSYSFYTCWLTRVILFIPKDCWKKKSTSTSLMLAVSVPSNPKHWQILFIFVGKKGAFL